MGASIKGASRWILRGRATPTWRLDKAGLLMEVSIVTTVVLDPICQASPVAYKLCSDNLVASESDCGRSGAASAKKHSPMCFFALLSGSGDYLLSHATVGARPMAVKARRTFWCALLSSVRYCCMSLLTSNPRWIAFVCRFPTKL